MKCVQDALIYGKKNIPVLMIMFLLYLGIYQTEKHFELNLFLLCVKKT